MDIEKISEAYTQFRDVSQTTFQALDSLMGKMQNAANNGDPQAGEWVSQLQNIFQNMQAGQGHIGDILQGVHGVMQFLHQDNSQKTEEGQEVSAPSSSGSFISDFLNSDLGKNIESQALQKIGGDFLGKFLK